MNEVYYYAWDTIPTNRVMSELLSVWGGSKQMGIKKVIINPPENPVATIFFWEDGDKTVVKTMNGDEYNFETALHQAMIEKFIFDGKKTKKNDYLHSIIKAYKNTNLDGKGAIKTGLIYRKCPHCNFENQVEKEFTGETKCRSYHESFSVNKTGRCKKL